MKIKKGDTVKVIAGKNRGATGEVVRALPREEKVVVSGVNVVKRHQRARGGTPGTIVEKPMPIHISNVLLIDARTKKPTRVRIMREGGVRKRISKKSGEEV